MRNNEKNPTFIRAHPEEFESLERLSWDRLLHMDQLRSWRRDFSHSDWQAPVSRPIFTSRDCLHRSALMLVEDFTIRDTDTELRGYNADFQLALPYRGLFEYSVGKPTLLDPNQILLAAGEREFAERQPIATVGHSAILLTPDVETVSDLRQCISGDAPPLDAAVPTTLALRVMLQKWLSIKLGWEATALERDELGIATIREAFHCKAIDGATNTPLIAKAKEIIHAHFDEPLSLKEIAAQLGVSPVYLTQSFSRSQGLPLYRYQLHLRLARAMVELPGTEDITSLALDLGFSSHSHFSTAFKAFAHQSPSSFRETHRVRAA